MRVVFLMSAVLGVVLAAPQAFARDRGAPVLEAQRRDAAPFDIARARKDLDLIGRSRQVLDPHGTGRGPVSRYTGEFLRFRLIAASLSGGHAPAWLAEYRARGLGREKTEAAFYPYRANREVKVASLAGLRSALARARGGDTIVLAPGNYGVLKLGAGQSSHPTEAFAPPVIVRSADFTHRAAFEGMHLNGVRNLIFDAITVERRFRAADPAWTKVLLVENARNLAIVNSEITGSDMTKGWGIAVGGSEGSDGVIVENTEFHNLYRGAVFGGATQSVVKGNFLFDMRSDGFDFTNVSRVWIEANHFSPFRTVKGDHADCVQFWSEGGHGSDDVVLRNNVMLVGDATQGIFVWDEANKGYRNFTVDGNLYYGTSMHGITIANLSGGTVRNNTAVAPPGAPDYAARINIKPRGPVRLIDNVASAFTNTGFAEKSGNVVLDYRNPDSPYFVRALLRNPWPGAVPRVEDFAPRDGGRLDRAAAGAVAPLGKMPRHRKRR